MKLYDEVTDWRSFRWQRLEFVLFLDSEMEPRAKDETEIRCNDQNPYVRIAKFRFSPWDNRITSPSQFSGRRARVCPYGSLPILGREEVDQRLLDKEASRLIKKHPGEAADLLAVPRRSGFVVPLIRSYRRKLLPGDQEAFVDLMKAHERHEAEQEVRARMAAVRNTPQSIAIRNAVNQLLGNQTAAACVAMPSPLTEPHREEIRAART